MTHPTAWDADGLRVKASLYFERAFAADPGDEVFAFWCHMALEQLARAAVAHVNPALLAAQRKPDALMYGLGLIDDGDPLLLDSAPIATVYEMCGRFVDGFGHAEQATCESARRRRNAELHSATAAMVDLPRGWVGRFFAVCRLLVRHLGLEFDDLLDTENVELVERLIVEDKSEIQHEVAKAIEEARELIADMSASKRKKREEAAKLELHPRRDAFGGVSPFAASRKLIPRLLGEVPCPACRTTVALRGEVLTRGTVQVDADGQLIQRQVAVPTFLHCPVCELEFDGVAELTVAGLADPVTLVDYPDPIDTFGIDLDDYRDEFLQSLADDYAYQDE